jgi:hypothetical protein
LLFKHLVRIGSWFVASINRYAGATGVCIGSALLSSNPRQSLQLLPQL